MHRKANLDALKKAIDLMGGINELAESLDISCQSIMNWQSKKSSIDLVSCLKIEKITDGLVKRKDLLPHYPWKDLKDVWQEIEKTKVDYSYGPLTITIFPKSARSKCDIMSHDAHTCTIQLQDVHVIRSYKKINGRNEEKIF